MVSHFFPRLSILDYTLCASQNTYSFVSRFTKNPCLSNTVKRKMTMRTSHTDYYNKLNENNEKTEIITLYPNTITCTKMLHILIALKMISQHSYFIPGQIIIQREFSILYVEAAISGQASQNIPQISCESVLKAVVHLCRLLQIIGVYEVSMKLSPKKEKKRIGGKIKQ